MKTALIAIGILVALSLTISPAFADTSQITAVPNAIPTDGITTLEICKLSTYTETINRLDVRDPSGTIWTHGPSAAVAIPLCPTTYDVPFGAGSAGWTSNDGDTAQTDESGVYSAVVLYRDGSRGEILFDASAFFRVPELALPAVVAPTVALAYLAFRNRLRRKN